MPTREMISVNPDRDAPIAISRSFELFNSYLVGFFKNAGYRSRLYCVC